MVVHPPPDLSVYYAPVQCLLCLSLSSSIALWMSSLSTLETVQKQRLKIITSQFMRYIHVVGAVCVCGGEPQCTNSLSAHHAQVYIM